MGYYADGDGSVDFRGPLDDRKCKSIDQILGTVFEFDRQKFSDGSVSYSIWDYEKYYGDDVESCLREVAQLAEIESGEIRYLGEDGSVWRFLYKKPGNVWVEQNGHVVYDE